MTKRNHQTKGARAKASARPSHFSNPWNPAGDWFPVNGKSQLANLKPENR